MSDSEDEPEDVQMEESKVPEASEPSPVEVKPSPTRFEQVQ